MANNVFKKYVIIGVILLFVGASVIPSIGSISTKKLFSTDFTKEEYIIPTEEKASTMLPRNIISKKPSKILMPGWFCVPKIVKKGDLVFCDVRPLLGEISPGFANDHALMYAGNNRFIEASGYWPWLYNGSKGWDLCKLGVVNTRFYFLNLWATNITYGKVINASESQRDAAVNWAESQKYHPYQYCYDPPGLFHKHSWWGCPNTNGTTYNPDTGTYFQEEYYDYWYCTELIWAAYKHCDGNSGIDLDAIWHYDKIDDSWHWWIGPKEMLGNVDQIYLYTDGDYGYPGTKEPIVESDHVKVGIDNVTLHGKLIDDGEERCHCYVTLIGEGNRYCGFYNSESIETFSYSFGGLKPGTTYQWYAWAYNSLGKVLGAIKNFTTLPSSI